MSARGEVDANVDVYYESPATTEDYEPEFPGAESIIIDDVTITGTRSDLEQFIKNQIEEFRGLDDPDHLCKQGVDGHGSVPEPRTVHNMMDWAVHQVTSYGEDGKLCRSVWVCERKACVLDAAAWALRSPGALRVGVTRDDQNLTFEDVLA